MAKTYFLIGSYYGGGRLQDLLDIVRGTQLDDYAILALEQRGEKRVPRGFSPIYNSLAALAVRDPACEVLWFLNDDILPKQDCFVATQRFLTSAPDVGVAFPVEAWHEPGFSEPVTLLPFSGEKTTIYEALHRAQYKPIDQIFAGFACVAIKREVWQTVGELGEFALGYCEDLDWGVRCWQAGYRIANWRGSWFQHERGGTFNRLVNDGTIKAEMPYEAAKLVQQKWPFLWSEPPEETLTRLRNWQVEAAARRV